MQFYALGASTTLEELASGAQSYRKDTQGRFVLAVLTIIYAVVYPRRFDSPAIKLNLA